MPKRALMLVALALFSRVARGGPNESLTGKLVLRLLDDEGVVFGLREGVGGLFAIMLLDVDARNAASRVAGEALSPYSRAMAFQKELRWLL